MTEPHLRFDDDGNVIYRDMPDNLIIAFCGVADCQCALSDPAPCEEYMEGFHPLGRCARCGWQHNFDPS